MIYKPILAYFSDENCSMGCATCCRYWYICGMYNYILYRSVLTLYIITKYPGDSANCVHFVLEKQLLSSTIFL